MCSPVFYLQFNSYTPSASAAEAAATSGDEAVNTPVNQPVSADSSSQTSWYKLTHSHTYLALFVVACVLLTGLLAAGVFLAWRRHVASKASPLADLKRITAEEVQMQETVLQANPTANQI